MSPNLFNKMKSKLAKKLIIYLNGERYKSMENSETGITHDVDEDTVNQPQIERIHRNYNELSGGVSSTEATPARKIMEIGEPIIERIEESEGSGEYSDVTNDNSNKSGAIETSCTAACTETIFTEEECTSDIKKLPVQLAVSVDYEHEARTSMRQRCRRRGLGKTELKEDLRNLHYTCNILIEVNMKDCNLW